MRTLQYILIITEVVVVDFTQCQWMNESKKEDFLSNGGWLAPAFHSTGSVWVEQSQQRKRNETRRDETKDREGKTEKIVLRLFDSVESLADKK